jgi:hypothetical protein
MIIPAPFALVDTEFDNSTEMALLLNSVAGYATLTYGPCFPGPGNVTNYTPTGLVNDSTAYTATVTIDADGTPHTQVVSVVGSAAQTFANLLTEIQTDLGVYATVTLVGSDIIITSATTGVLSSVVVSGAVVTSGSFVVGTTYKIVSVGTTDFTAIGAGSSIVGVTFVATGVGSGTGTASANADTHPLFHSVKGGPIFVPAGSFVVGISYRITTVGTTDFTAIGASNSTVGVIFTATGVGSGTGAASGVLSATYAFGIEASASTSVRGGTNYVVWGDLDGGTQANISSTVTAFLAATTANTNVSWTSGTDVLAFTPVYPDTTVRLNTDTGLTLDPTIPYDLNLTIDGVATKVILDLKVPYATNNPVTFSQLLQSLKLALVAIADVTFTQGAIGTLTITSKSVGTGSTVAIAAGSSHDLIAALAAFAPANGPLAGFEKVTMLGAGVAATDYATTTGSPTTYYFKVATDGGAAVEYPVAISGNISFTALAALLDTAWTGGTVAFDDTGDHFVFTSGTTGPTSTVVVTAGTTGAGDIFTRVNTDNATVTGFTYDASVAGVGGGAGVNGTTNVTFPNTKILPSGNENNVTSTGIVTLGIVVGGASYTNGTYTNVPLTGGTGTGAQATVVVAGTVVSTVTLTAAGIGYTTGNTLSALAANIGGTGSGFTIPVANAAVGSKAFANWKDVMQLWPSPTGYGAMWTASTSANTFRQFAPSAKGRVVRTAVYYNGSNWVYFNSGATLGGAVAPPELIV